MKPNGLPFKLDFYLTRQVIAEVEMEKSNPLLVSWDMTKLRVRTKEKR